MAAVEEAAQLGWAGPRRKREEGEHGKASGPAGGWAAQGWAGTEESSAGQKLKKGERKERNSFSFSK